MMSRAPYLVCGDWVELDDEAARWHERATGLELPKSSVSGCHWVTASRVATCYRLKTGEHAVYDALDSAYDNDPRPVLSPRADCDYGIDKALARWAILGKT